MDITNYAAVSPARVSSIMKRVYGKMTLGLLVTSVVAYLAANSLGFIQFMMANSWAMWVLILAEFGLVIGISAGINRLSSATATLLFYLFAVVNGLMLFTVLLAYSPTAIAKTFLITAGMFGVMSVYGFCTNRDLTRWGNLLFMALIGLILASVANIFFHSEGLAKIIPYIGVLIFVGLTAWDTQQIKNMAAVMPEATAGRLSTLGALSLYLDFINLFLYLLRIFGDNRD